MPSLGHAVRRFAGLFTFDGDRIAAIEVIGDAARLAGMTIAIERRGTERWPT